MKLFLTYLCLALLLGSCGILNGNSNSPRSIVLSFSGGNTHQIYTMREDGSGLEKLTSFKYSATFPKWSPDGSKIAFSAPTEGLGADGTLWVMDADGGNQKPLVYNPRSGNPQWSDHISWSPDGKKVAFDFCLDCEAFGSNEEIFIADLESGSIDTLTRYLGTDFNPSWSPDGTHIAFLSNRHNPEHYRVDVYLADLNSGEISRLTHTLDNGRAGVLWLSGGKEFLSWTNDKIWRSDLTGENVHEIDVLMPRVLYRSIIPLGVSSNGEKLLLRAIAKDATSRDFSFHMLNTKSGEIERITDFKDQSIFGLDWKINAPRPPLL